MKILQIPEWYPTVDNPQLGVFNREIALAAALVGKSHVLVIKIIKDLPFKKIETHIVNSEICEIFLKIGSSPIPGTTRFVIQHLYNHAISEYFKKFGKPDIIHSQDLVAYRVLRSPLVERNSIPVLVSQHWTAFIRNILTSQQVSRYKIIFKKAAFILPAMKEAEYDYLNLGLAGNVEWLPNVLDTDVFYLDRTIKREERILHISGFTDQKRVEDIIHAFAKVFRFAPHSKLILVGEGVQRAKYEAMASDLLPRGSFEFKGFLEKKSVANELRMAKCFVFPSTFETFGCVLMEAAACGCPIVGTRVGGIASVLNEDEAIFIEPGDIEGITAGIQLCLEGKHMINLEKVAQNAMSRFSKEQIGVILKGYYLRSLSNPI